MENPMYDAQLNRHEDQIRDIDGRLHSYDLALKWCEGQIKKLAGDDYSSGVVLTEDKESLEAHNDNQCTEINRLLKANEALKKEIQELKTRLGPGNPIEKEYDKLKGDHNLLKEAYKALDDRYEREKEIWSGKYDALQTTIAMKNRRITSLEQGTKTQGNIIDQKNSEICHLKSEKANWLNSLIEKDGKIYDLDRSVKTQIDIIDHLRAETEKWKEAYLRSQVDVDNFQRSYSTAKTENDRLTECLAKYAWRRVSTIEASILKDRELYLFVVDGYSTPVIGRYHDDAPSHISILVDDLKGLRYKAVFFMDGVIRYWMPLPEMPDTAIK